ncbi:MAG: NOL1/NOP2/sun family putative RNA methylase [Candidatus Gracilibacteria bacterium]|nr:NOL1/NOP2/sun family putative RNA methylase [Candidatus Gracilibacteria bacterium]
MKQDFLDYIKNTFDFNETEFKNFKEHLEKPLKKSFRINTNKISIDNFKKLVKRNDWELTESNFGKNMFYIDRTTDLKIPLGSTFEHIMGLIYIQEVAASSSPFFMSGDIIDNDQYLILDMSSSPGGKTTQLSEYYPNSLIVANEFDKPRIKQLFTNIERMGCDNIGVTNYDGRFFKSLPELFDKVLLDAPCSGEGTCYKGTDAIKFWNAKNIKSIAKLQFGLLESALITCKVGGEIVFSTCTLNKIENEGVLKKFYKKYGNIIETIKIDNEETKRLWPHTDKTGGFFITKIRKIASVDKASKQMPEPKNTIEKLSSRETKTVLRFLEENFDLDIKNYFFYKHNSEIYISKHNFGEYFNKLFFFKVGVKIGELTDIFTPCFNLGVIFDLQKNVYNIDETSEKINSEIDRYLKAYDLENKTALKKGYIAIKYKNTPAGLAEIQGENIKNLLPTKYARK